MNAIPWLPATVLRQSSVSLAMGRSTIYRSQVTSHQHLLPLAQSFRRHLSFQPDLLHFLQLLSHNIDYGTSIHPFEGALANNLTQLVAANISVAFFHQYIILNIIKGSIRRYSNQGKLMTSHTCSYGSKFFFRITALFYNFSRRFNRLLQAFKHRNLQHRGVLF